MSEIDELAVFLSFHKPINNSMIAHTPTIMVVKPSRSKQFFYARNSTKKTNLSQSISHACTQVIVYRISQVV